MCFKNLVGNENNKYILKETITKGNILHSYMFFGTEGIGKKIFALEFAKMILCENQKNSPCEKCKSCIEFDSNNNPDFFTGSKAFHWVFSASLFLKSSISAKTSSGNSLFR